MIALIFCGDLKYCPYIKRYIERIEECNEEYCVYFWNRGNFSLELPSNYHYYNAASDLKSTKAKKFIDFMGYRKWLTKELKVCNPDKIIVLSTLSGIILGKKLYKGKARYIFDIRDYSYEHIPFFYYIEKKLIQNSYFTAISSEGFKCFLPKNEYVIAHNFNRGDINGEWSMKKTEGVINIVWNGVVRYFDYQKRYLDALKNDERFNIIFHGDGPDLKRYMKYCEDNNFSNVRFTGAYDNSKKAELLENAHILNNCYGYLSSRDKCLKNAISNRFYDGLIYHIPQLVESQGFKTNWVVSEQLGINYNADCMLADKLYDYYWSIDTKEFDESCSKNLQSVIEEDNKYIEKIDMFVKGEF